MLSTYQKLATLSSKRPRASGNTRSPTCCRPCTQPRPDCGKGPSPMASAAEITNWTPPSKIWSARRCSQTRRNRPVTDMYCPR
eukprot:scaffold1004_cov269-Pinguiococcus_pyrenoidosus.AAC.20